MSLFSNISRAQDLDKSTVKTLDLSNYLGSWYELARFDHTFERGMQEVMAFYELRDDGKIDVINSGIKNGKYKVAYGKAKLTDEPGVLRVSFFGPFYSDYRVLMLDDDYEYALGQYVYKQERRDLRACTAWQAHARFCLLPPLKFRPA